MEIIRASDSGLGLRLRKIGGTLLMGLVAGTMALKKDKSRLSFGVT